MIFGNRRKTDDERRQQPETKPSNQPEPVHPITVMQRNHSFETVLGVSSILEGSLKCEGNIRLDGTFTGQLSITGNVLVGEKAVIQADINAQNVSIAGQVKGNVSGKRVQILETGRVEGDITAASLSTAEGAIIEGKISMKSQEEPITPDIIEGELADD